MRGWPFSSAPSFVYLVQGEARLLRKLQFPADAPIFALCYDKNISLSYAEQTLFDPVCSWTAGRNRLLALATTRYPDANYYVLCDDDIEFAKGSFEQFEMKVAKTRPAVAVPVVPKSMHAARRDLAVQRTIHMDEQMVALHRSIVGSEGISPMIEAYDDISWYVACLIFEYSILKFHGPYCHQYNDIIIKNTAHRQSSESSSYKSGSFQHALSLFREHIRKAHGSYDWTVIEAVTDLRRRFADFTAPHPCAGHQNLHNG